VSDLRPRAPRGDARAPCHRAQAGLDVDAAVAGQGREGVLVDLARLRPARHAPARARRRRRLPQPAHAGLKATADAERLAIAVTQAHERLDPPGPFKAIDETPDVEHATWLAFLFALAPELHDLIDQTRPTWEDAESLDALPEAKAKTAAAYRAWVERQGPTQEAAFTGEEIWSPERRFARVFERLALPGFTRAMRYDLLAALGAADIYPLEPDQLFFSDGDATTDAAKRLLVSGDRMLLERRARDLAEASQLPISAFDRGLAVWGAPTVHVDLTAEPHPGIAAALGLR
jgi:hypothetical protein